jgi:hypothetical protein
MDITRKPDAECAIQNKGQVQGQAAVKYYVTSLIRDSVIACLCL